ncbi:DUF4328 domain-containing protein [Pseudonocardiaceae bacterium YIM PH 21723]|nr:DUF4328 domain-containing protein [Pseudonocardiaceae bacterium YIM PH 21723]
MPMMPVVGPMPERVRAMPVRTGMAITLLVLVMIANVARAGAIGYRMYVDPGMQMGATVVGWTQWACAALFLAAAIAVICWMWGAAGNAQWITPPGSQRFGQVWALFGWLIPFGCLFLPAMQLSDLSRTTGRPHSGALVGWWWAMWLIFDHVSGALMYLLPAVIIGFGHDKAQAFALVLAVLSMIFALTSGLLLIALIRRINAGQLALAGELTPAGAQEVAPGAYGDHKITELGTDERATEQAPPAVPGPA